MTTYALRPQPVETTAERLTVVATDNTEANPYKGLIAVLPEAVEVDYSEGAAILDRAARRKLQMSGEEFIARWDAGDLGGDEENVAAQEVAMLLPMARPTAASAR